MSSNVLYDAPGPKAKRLSLILSIVFAIVFLALIGFGVYQLWLGGTFYQDRWDIFLEPSFWTGSTALLAGLRVTLSAFAVGSVLALVIGFAFALARASHTRWVRIPATIVLEFFRGMPVLLMILFILIVASTGPFWAVVIALGVYNGAIIGEAIRSGIASLPKGQRESGLAIGLGSFQTTVLIELPQAVRTMLPIIIAQLVVLLKDTALGYIVSSADLITIGRRLAQYYGAGQYMLSIFFVLLAIYLVLNLTLSWVARAVAARVSRPRRGGSNLDGTSTEAIPLATQTLRAQQGDPGADPTRLPPGEGGAGPGRP